MYQDILFQQREQTFKKLGATLETTVKYIERGLDIAGRIESARDEYERELYCSMVVQSVHHSWQNLMKLMRRIAKDVDHDIPKGRGASLALVDRMSQRTSERPGILGMKHIDAAKRIGQIHKDYRQAKITHNSFSEVVGLLEVINSEILPEMAENVRLMALASPDGVKLVEHLQPKSSQDNTVVDVQPKAKKPPKTT